jgi:hypothetical protein
MPSIFIYGSCVSRDTQPFLGQDWHISEYVARQSFISATNGPVETWGQSTLRSPFQTRSLAGDFAGDFLPKFFQNILEVDILLMDLVDERLGVYRTAQGGCVTLSWELTNSGLELQAPPGILHVEFGSEVHFNLWSKAAESILQAVRSTPVVPVVLAPAWAAKADNGGGGFDYRGVTAEVWNSKYDRYFQFLESLGAIVIRVPPERTYATTNHRWGLAPFHYYDRVYETMSKQIRDAYAQARSAQRT